MKTVTVNVTQEHIDKGVPHDGCRCPLALALQQAGFPTAAVGFTQWWPNVDARNRHLPLPADARAFARNVSHRIAVRPATFVLEVE